MNRDLIVNICGTIQLVCVGTLGYLALKRNEECHDAQMKAGDEKAKRILVEMDNIYLKNKVNRLEKKLKEQVAEEQ